MGFWLKAMSVLTGSSEELLLSARKEIQMVGKNHEVSDEVEKNYVFEEIIKYVKAAIQSNNREFTTKSLQDKELMTILIALLIEEYRSENNIKKIQIFNRVLFRYYGFTAGGSTEELIPAVGKLADEIIVHCRHKNIF